MNALTSSGRRSHHKSRSGCVQCKRRKIKCDETKPACKRCVLHAIDCSFSTTSTTTTPPSDESASQPSETRGEDPETPLPSKVVPGPPEWALFDMELLHHFTTSTCYSLSHLPEVQKMWQVEVPAVGFSSPSKFVLYAIIALSALHMARVRPERRTHCLSWAQSYHNLAVQAIAPMVTRVAEENCTSLFLFSALTSMFSCGRPRTPDDFLVMERGRLSEWIIFCRGNKTIIDHGGHLFYTGLLAPLFANSYKITASRNGHAGETEAAHLWNLKARIRSQVMDPWRVGIYLDAVTGLEKSFAGVIRFDSSMSETGVVLAWLMEVSDEYLDLLRREEPIALVIFAHFCVLLKKLEAHWWMEGLSDQLMSELLHVLDEKYREWLWWPLESSLARSFMPTTDKKTCPAVPV